MDTMTVTKLTGAVCGALLVYLLSQFASEFIYFPKAHGDHGQAYEIVADE